MQKQIEKRIQTFVEGLGGITRSEMMNGTLYIKSVSYTHLTLPTIYSV